MRSLWQAGRRIPEDCSVIGFDDVPQAALSSPGITTIRQPMLEMGSLATRLVLDAIALGKRNGSPQENLLHLLAPEVVQRDSTRKLARPRNANRPR